MTGSMKRTLVVVAFVTLTFVLLTEPTLGKNHHKKHKKHQDTTDGASITHLNHKKLAAVSEHPSMELTAAIKSIEEADEETKGGLAERSAPIQKHEPSSKSLVSAKSGKRRVLDKYKHGGRNVTKHPLASKSGVSDRNAPMNPYQQLGCAEWEGDCEYMYSNASTCDKMVPICTYGYFRSKDKQHCIADDDCYIECNGPGPTQPPPVSKCGENEEFVECPLCPDPWCKLITNPWTRECDQREDCYRKGNITSNYCLLRPGCQCKKGYVRQYPGQEHKCVPEASCFERPCKDNEHWDRCPRCADLNCDNVHIKNVTERNAPGFCYKAQCMCDEGFVRETSRPGAPCIPVEKCIRCKANEHYDDCPKCEDIQCELLQPANGRKPAAQKTNSHLVKGVNYCAPPGCKCNKGYARVKGKEGCILENECPNLPKGYTPGEHDDC